MGDFEGKVVIVTGGALGMGSTTAMEFAREGAAVVVADMNRQAGEANLSRIRAKGGKGLFVEADVSRASYCHCVVDEAVKSFGGVDILFNNVGIQPPNSYKNVEDTPEDIWDRILDVNLKSYFLMSKYAIPQMRRRGGCSSTFTSASKALSSSPTIWRSWTENASCDSPVSSRFCRSLASLSLFSRSNFEAASFSLARRTFPNTSPRFW